MSSYVWISLYGVKSVFFYLTSDREHANATCPQYLMMSRICRTKQASCAASLTPSPPCRAGPAPARAPNTHSRSPLVTAFTGVQCCGCCVIFISLDLCTGYREISDWCRPRRWCRAGAGGGHQAALRPAARPGAAQHSLNTGHCPGPARPGQCCLVLTSAI